MKKTFSKSELKEKAQKVFEQYPTAEQVFATADGNIFLMKNRAELHSKDKIITFDRALNSEDQKAPNTDSKKNDSSAPERISATDAIKAIEASKSIIELTPFSKDKRATVKAAYEKKVEELAKLIDVKE